MTDLLTTAEVAELLGKRKRTIQRMVARQELEPAWKLPGRYGGYLFDRRMIESIATEEPAATGGPVVLYRMWNADGDLLYVGVTKDLGRRIQGHQSRSAWYPGVSSITSEPFDSRSVALVAERKAIQAEGPLHNCHGTVPSCGFEQERWK